MNDNLIEFVTKLHKIDATFTAEDFINFDTANLTEHSFVYANPPYLIGEATYNDGNRGFGLWTQKQENELYDFLDGLNDRGIKFALTNVLKHKGKYNRSVVDWALKYNIKHLNETSVSNLTTDWVLITNY